MLNNTQLKSIITLRQIKITNRITNKDSRKYFADVKFASSRIIGDEADMTSDELVLKNLPFAISVAKKYRGHGIPDQDLEQVANIGLIIASRRFDPTKGFKFISYAVHWITQQIEQEIYERGSITHIPGHIARDIHKIHKQLEQFFQEEGYIPKYADESLIDSENDGVRSALNLKSIVRLDNPIGDEDRSSNDGDTLIQRIAGENNVEDDIINNDIKIEIERILNFIGGREEQIIRDFYFNNKTFEEIAEEHKLSRERIRQIHSKTLRNIKQLIKKKNICI